MREKLSRRTLLAATLASTAPLAAGCLSGEKSASASATGAKDDIGSQPRIGPPLDSADGLIVAFEDPSCPACRQFEQNTFPKLDSKLIQTGEVAYVYREFPHVQEWARRASEALETTYAHHEKAFWGLKSYYYDAFTSIGVDNVFEKTQHYLASHTDLDADAIVREAKAKKYQHALSLDEQARKKAGVTGTPTFFLYSNGSFDTKLTGGQDFSVFKNSLGV